MSNDVADTFDPYYKWLGIPTEQRPPNLYQLVGVQLFEKDFDVIANACDQRMSHLRTFSNSQHRDHAEKLLNEVSSARVTLLNPRLKAGYDSTLRAKYPPPGQSGIASRNETRKLAPGDQLDEFTLLERTGGGKTGVLWKAKHRLLGKVVAIKIMPEDSAKFPEWIKRLQREVKITAKLSHPNLMSATDAGVFHGIHYLVQDYFEGQELSDVLKERGPLPVEQTLHYLLQAARGLEYAHQRTIYHRNVKPANMMVDAAGHLRVTNMIMARVEDNTEAYMSLVEGLTSPGFMMGTGDYLAPEQAADAATADARADIYSLGCTLHELLIGTPPFTEKGVVQKLLAHKNKPAPSLQAQRPDVPQWLDQLYQKMLAKEPAQRYQSMSELIAALERGRKSRSGLPVSPLLLVVGSLVVFVGCTVLGLVAAAFYFVFLSGAAGG
ncbi:MAG TPA: serine/threonine-protein kinase [Pirellulaceae bacterium]|nr:serine/threonine-protein kinase [Pirellulaceae bacterium]